MSGILYFCSFHAKNEIEIEEQIQLNIGCNNVAFSHRDEHTVVASCDDFVLRMFDLQKINVMYKEYFDVHKARRIDWDKISLEQILTATPSDKSVKVYNTVNEENDQASAVFSNHEGQVLDAQWNSHSTYTCYSCDQSGQVYLWDIRQGDEAAMKFAMYNRTCAMRMDNNIFDEYALALGSFDQNLFTYDLRNINVPKACITNVHYSLITECKVCHLFL